MKLSEKVNVSFALTAVPPASAGFSVPLLIGAFPEVPIDRRYRIVSKSDYATIMDTTTEAQNWCSFLWGQNYNVAQAYMGRWVNADSNPYFACVSPATFDASWASGTPITNGSLDIKKGVTTSNVTAIDLTGDTSWTDVCASIEAGTGFPADVTVSVDVLGRIIFTNTTGVGSAQDDISVLSSGTGTDLTTSTYLNIDSGISVSGMDAEDPDAALAAILEKTNVPYEIHEIGASASQQVALGIACAVYKKLLMLNLRLPAVKDSASTTDAAYLLDAANNSYAYGIYTEHAAQYPTAAVNGEILPRPEGSAAMANNALQLVYESGLSGGSPIALTPGERTALNDKNCDYLVAPVSPVHCERGLTFAGIEVKHRVGYNWAEVRSAEEIYAYLLANEVTYNDVDIQAICGILYHYIDILVKRKCVASYEINVPSAADISLIVQATHTLSLLEIASAISAYAVNDVVMTATATA
ncbi:MAG: DUF3383 family protein [Desulfobacteraceae bacterium]|jgi:hypothetical protein